MRLLREAKAVWDEFSAMGAATHASSISYYTFLSLVPLLALCISLVSLLGVSQQAVYDFLITLVPDALSDLVTSLVNDAFERSGLAFSLSTLSLVWSASKGARALRVGLNAAYDQQENRNAVEVALISIAAIVILGVLIAAAMWMVFGDSLLHALSRHVPGMQVHGYLLKLTDVIATIAMGIFPLALCYTQLPAGRRPFLAQLPGAVFSLFGSGVLSLGFRLYVDHFANYTVLYGSIATVAMLLFWMYLVFFVLMAGGFLNRYLRSHRESADGTPHAEDPLQAGRSRGTRA